MTTIELHPRMLRPRAALLSGVCGGLAAHLGVRLWRVRVFFVLASLLAGAGVLFYLWLWALVPFAPGTSDSPAPSRATPVAAFFVAIAATATVFVLSDASSNATVTMALWGVVLGSGLAVVWSLVFDRGDPKRTRAYLIATRALAIGLLGIAGVLTLVGRPTPINAVLAVALIALAVAVAVAPLVVQLWTDLLAQRAVGVRELQRAEIAAHLHDSVLQTLALIQNQAGASSDIARIARAQERELREWLVVGEAPAADDLAAELSSIAAGIELDYPVRIEVVAAGQSVAGHRALVSAAREAMVNAARHAGGTVSVYLETSAGAIDVFVRDRGPGLDLAALPPDRRGIRESIVGRMTRAGGVATIKPTTLGTEVHLHLEVKE